MAERCQQAGGNAYAKFCNFFNAEMGNLDTHNEETLDLTESNHLGKHL